MGRSPDLTRLIIGLAAFLSAAGACLAAPVIARVDGEFHDKKRVTILGADFGTKEPAKPLVWADFESGLQPTDRGRKTAWDEVTNMEVAPQGWRGKGARARDGSGKWAFRVDYKYWTKDGQKLYVFKHQKMNFLITDNS